MLKKIAHVGIAVKDLRASSVLFGRILGKAAYREEELPEHKVKTAFFELGESSIELTEAIDRDSPIARFIEKNGEGVHHISFVVDDIGQEIARLRREGFKLVEENPRTGAQGNAVAFLHPKSTNGVLIELCQKA